MSDTRKNCPMRHENGNCLPCGGFCTAVNDEICHALHNAYTKGHNSAMIEAVPIEKFDELIDFTDAVCGFLPACVGCEGKTEEGYRTDKCRYVIDSKDYTDYIENRMYCFKRGLDNYISMTKELEELKKEERDNDE